MSYVSFENNIQNVILVTGVNHTGDLNFSDATGLSLPMMANTSYEFEFEIIFRTNGTTRGIGLSVNGPTGPINVLVHTEIPTSLTTVTMGIARAYDTGAVTTAIDLASPANNYARCYGFVSNGTTAGNLILRYRTNNIIGIAYVDAGSTMKMWRINPSN